MYLLLLLGSIVFLDLCLSGDNALVIAMAANNLPADQRERAIYSGMALAAALRVLLALAATTLLANSWVALIGGFALLWVAYNLGMSLLSAQQKDAPVKKATSFASAMLIIVIADVSMSLDNVLAVAALARNHWFLLILGIIASIALLTIAAKWTAKLLERYNWINWIGLVLILYVAFDLITGSYDVTMSMIRN